MTTINSTPGHNFQAGAALEAHVAARMATPRILPASVTQTVQHADLSDRYVFINTGDLIRRFEDKGLVVREASESRTRKEGHEGYQRHIVKMSLPVDQIRVGDTNPEIVIGNSHNGGGSCWFNLGLFRFKCSNGLMVSTDLGRISVRHFGNNVQKIVEDALDDLHTQLPLVAEHVKKMQELTLSNDQIEMFARQALDIRGIPKKAEEKGLQAQLIQNLKIARRTDDAGQNLWEVFNRVQENIIRGTKGLRQIKGMARDIDLNRKLWTLAETYSNAA
jgi:hypothetical protein